MNDDLSPIKILNLLVERLKVSQIPSISLEYLSIQQDALNRIIDDTVIADEAFAVYGHYKVEDDESFGFTISFHKDFFLIDIYGLVNSAYSYEIFKNENDFVDQILISIGLLLNGQISILNTHKGNSICATEILLFKKSRNKPIVIATIVQFPILNFGQYHIYLKRNKINNTFIKIPEDYFLYKKADSKYPILGRTIQNTGFTPLTKDIWQTNVREISYNQMGKSDSESTLHFILRLPQIWMLIFGVILFFIIIFNEYLPKIIQENIFLFVPTVFGYLIYTLISRITESDNIEFIQKGDIVKTLPTANSIFIIFLSIFSAFTLVLPSIVLPNESKVISMLELSSKYPVTFLVFVGYLFPVLLVLFKRKSLRYIAGGIFLCAYILMFYIIFSKTDIDRDIDNSYLIPALLNIFVPLLALCGYFKGITMIGAHSNQNH